MLKLNLQYFGHLMWRADSLEKTLMLGKIECGRRRGWERMRWLDGITNSMDMNLSKLWEWWWTGRPGVLQSMGSQRVGHNWVTNTSLSFSSVAQSCPTLCNPMDRSMPGFPVLHLPEFAQTHVHWVSDAIQPSHPLSSPFPPVFNLSQHQGPFQWILSHQLSKVVELQLQHQSLQWIFRIGFL